MKIYILKEEDQVRYTSKILGAYRNKEIAIEDMRIEGSFKKYSIDEKILSSSENQIIIGYCNDEYYNGVWDTTRILNLIETELKN